MKMIRSQHFKDYVENLYVQAGQRTKSWTTQQAKDAFRDKFYDDYASLTWIMESTFPESRFNGSDYEFKTVDIQHRTLGKTETENVGRVVITLDSEGPVYSFENKRFMHPHINTSKLVQASTNGRINCWGNFLPFQQALVKHGFSTALMDLYQFATISGGGATLPSSGAEI